MNVFTKDNHHCPGDEQEYMKAIADYAQAYLFLNSGNANFRIIGLQTKYVSLSECIQIMHEDAKRERQWALKTERDNLQYLKKTQTFYSRYGGEGSQLVLEECRKNIELSRQRIQSLEYSPPYENNQDEDQMYITAIYAICQFHILKSDKSYRDITETFILTEGGIVVGKESSKKGA